MKHIGWVYGGVFLVFLALALTLIISETIVESVAVP